MSEVKICPTCGSEYPMSERFCPRDGSALKSQNPQADLVGTMIAQSYHVIKKLGEGGMGAVYLAEHVKMGRKSAIKVMNPGMSQDQDAIMRFNREAANASRMNHPNICAIYDFGETTDGVIYLAMEFIEGESLTSLIERIGSLPPARAASILHQTADGLQVAHDYGIVHRDLKPDNIMIAKGRDNSDLVKVVDFGIAKAHSSDAQKVTKTGLVVGTPEYMSPEQLSGDKLDGRSDIYSLALVGFNMLTGTLPFQSNSAQEAMIMRLTDQPRTLAEVKPEVAWPEELQRVMDKALARNVSERYQKASDFGREFSMAIENMPATSLAEAGTQVIGVANAAPTSAIPRTRVASSGEKAAAKVAPASTPVKSGRGMMVGAGVAVVVVLGVAGWILTPKHGTAAGTPTASNSQSAPPTDTVTKPAPPGTTPSQPKNDAVGKQPVTKAGNTGSPVVSAPPASTPPATNSAFDRDLKELETLTDGNSDSKTDAAKAVDIATRILPGTTGDIKARILFARGFAKLILDDHSAAGCADLTAAKNATSESTTIGKINALLAQTDCK